MTPTEEQTAEERDILSEQELNDALRNLCTSRIWEEAHASENNIKRSHETLRLTNQRLEAENGTLRARTEDMKELEQGLMMKETHIKELEAEVERMKKELALWYEVGRPGDRHRVRCSCNGCNLRAMLADLHFRELSSREQRGEL